MEREARSAEEIRLELDRMVRSFALDGEAKDIEFQRPTLCFRADGGDHHNWDVDVFCSESSDDIARRAVEAVSDKWDMADE
jgi:hypothetical protein